MSASMSDMPKPFGAADATKPISSAQESQPVCVLVRASARPDQIEQAMIALMRIAGPIGANPDCLEFRVYQVRDDPRSFILLEQWISEEALSDHQKRGYMAEYMAQKDKIFERLGGDFLREVHPGDLALNE